MAPRGLQDGPVVTMALPKPRGLGRGYRPFQQKLNTFLDPETQRTNHNHEPIFIRNTEHKTGRTYNLVSHSRDSRPIFEGLPRSSSMFALSAAQIRAQVPRDADTKSSQWRRSISQPHVACKSTDNGRMIGGRSMYGVATRIPMCWGDSVTIYVNRATCWIPIEFLEKVFNCPGSLLASSSTCCTRGFVFRPTNSVCYHCYKLIKNRFERYLSQETKPILNTLRLILDYKFKKESGLSLSQYDWHRCISDRQALL